MVKFLSLPSNTPSASARAKSTTPRCDLLHVTGEPFPPCGRWVGIEDDRATVKQAGRFGLVQHGKRVKRSDRRLMVWPGTISRLDRDHPGAPCAITDGHHDWRKRSCSPARMRSLRSCGALAAA